MFFFLFFSEKYQPPSVGVNAYPRFRMPANILPGLLHAFAPVNIVKNKNRIVLGIFQA